MDWKYEISFRADALPENCMLVYVSSSYVGSMACKTGRKTRWSVLLEFLVSQPASPQETPPTTIEIIVVSYITTYTGWRTKCHTFDCTHNTFLLLQKHLTSVTELILIGWKIIPNESL